MCDLRLLEKVRGMLEQKEQLRQNEIQFKDDCRQELTRLQKEMQWVFILTYLTLM